MTTTFMSSDKVHWAYDRVGRGAPLVMLHGWGVDRRIWRQQSKYFEDDYEILMIDLPGHGQSSWRPMTVEEIARGLSEVIHEIFSDQLIHVLGSSLGGLVLMQMAILGHPIKSMTLVGSMPRFFSGPDSPYGLAIKRIDKLARQLETDYPSMVHVFFRSLFTYHERQSRRYRWIQMFRRDVNVPSKESLLMYLDILKSADLCEAFKACLIPLQFINGDGDEICHRKAVAQLKRDFPNAHFVDFVDIGHFPFLIDPYPFNDALRTFLKEQVGSCSVNHRL